MTSDVCRRRASRAGLERAKQNIEKYYTLVGTLEELPVFLRLLERILPQFFKGVHDMYRSESAGCSYMCQSESAVCLYMVQSELAECSYMYQIESAVCSYM